MKWNQLKLYESTKLKDLQSKDTRMKVGRASAICKGIISNAERD